MDAERQQGKPYQRLLFPESPEGLRHGAAGAGRPEAEAPQEPQTSTASEPARALTERLMEEGCKPDNLNQACRPVKANKGAPVLDGMTVEDLSSLFAEHKQGFIDSLLEGSYQPQPVRGAQIPKPGGGGVRPLGIPTVIDRLVQQAILQVLEPLLDPTFSASRYGFRPGRGAHDALLEAREYVAEGRVIVVDVDLEKCFDRVNHDILRGPLARRVADKRLLRIIRRFLEAGLMQDGVCIERHEGTAQGGPLSPLLANLLLDERDKELERRASASVATPTTATSTCHPRRRGNGSWRRSPGSLKRCSVCASTRRRARSLSWKNGSSWAIDSWEAAGGVSLRRVWSGSSNGFGRSPGGIEGSRSKGGSRNATAS